MVAPAEHGTARRYKRGCRCASCKAAHAAEQRRARARRHAEGLPPGAVHGQSTYDNWRCRCPVCSAAKADAFAVYAETVVKPRRREAARQRKKAPHLGG